MKHNLLTLAVALGLAGSLCMAGEIKIGDSQETVISVLGLPTGHIQTDHRNILFFDRGSVELEDGQVMSASLVSPEAANARRLERMRQDELAQQAAAKRSAEGQALRDLKLSDPAFLALPASGRVAYWQAFMQEYPGVSAGLDDNAAQREVQTAGAARRAEADRAQQLAEVQERAFEAQQRAADAEARAQESYSSPFSSYSYPVFVCSSHFIRSRRDSERPPEPPRRKVEDEHRLGVEPFYARGNKPVSRLDLTPEERRGDSFDAHR